MSWNRVLCLLAVIGLNGARASVATAQTPVGPPALPQSPVAPPGPALPQPPVAPPPPDPTQPPVVTNQPVAMTPPTTTPSAVVTSPLVSPQAPGLPLVLGAGEPLTLSGATTAALAANPASMAAQFQVTQAQAKLAQAQAQTRSQVTFSSSGSVSNAAVIQSPPAHETFGTLVNTITLPLPLGRKARLSVRQANAQLAAAQATYAAARLGLAGQIGATYYDLLRKQALLGLAQETLASAQRQLADARKRFAAGDVPELDTLRAEVPVATAQAAVYQVETTVVIARQTLNSVLGRDLDAPVALADVPATVADAPLPLTLADARRTVREGSPEIRAAQATVDADTEALGIAGLSREPIYALQASDTRSNDQTAFSRLDAVQATVTIPLSDGGLAAAQKREAQAALRQARAQFEVARRTAEIAVSSAYFSASGSRRQIAAARTARDVARTTYDKTVIGYRAGLFPLTDVLNAQSALTQANIAYTQAVYDAAVATAALNNALGIFP